MLSYERIHNRKPEWVVFLHGIGGSRRTFKYQIAEFSRHYNLLLIDLHGHGNSMGTRLAEIDRPSLAAIAEDVLKTLDEVGIEKAHFVGVSSGAMVETALANLAPHRIHSLIMSGAAIRFRRRVKVSFVLIALFRHILSHRMLYRLFAWIMMPYKNHKLSRDIFIREASKMSRSEFYLWFDLTRKFEKEYPLSKHISTDIHKLYVMGAQDHMLGSEVTAKYARLDKKAEIHIIPRCGHVCNIDNTTEFNRIALDFLVRNSSLRTAKETAAMPI